MALPRARSTLLSSSPQGQQCLRLAAGQPPEGLAATAKASEKRSARRVATADVAAVCLARVLL
eukprot:2588407-Lingulodinium_polyedra.AAC.1